MNGDPITRNGPRWSFQWKKFVMNHNDVKPFGEVIKIETEFLTSECVEKGTQFFLEAPDVKVLEESKANNILR